MKEQAKAVHCQLRTEPIACTNSTPIVNDREIMVRKAPLFLGLVISAIMIEPNGPSNPIEMPCRNLADIMPATFVDISRTNHPVRIGKTVNRWDFFLPNLSITGVIIILPMMRANPIMDAEKEKKEIMHKILY